MASSFSPYPVETNLSQNSYVPSNISEADLSFYRAVELQTGLIQDYRNAIFNMVVAAADVAGRMPKSPAQEGIRTAKTTMDNRKKDALQALRTAAGSVPSGNNQGNVATATNLLMNNCVQTLQQLDVIADATLVQCVEMILNSIPAA
jgi:hypothetical protein